jgi:hypothetical protein
MRLAVEKRVRPHGSKRPCSASQTGSFRRPQTSAHPGLRWGCWGGARRLTVWHVSSCPFRRVGMPAPVPPCRHHRPVGSWVGRRAALLTCRPSRDAMPHGGRAPNWGAGWHRTCTRSVQPPGATAGADAWRAGPVPQRRGAPGWRHTCETGQVVPAPAQGETDGLQGGSLHVPDEA